jgi:hypothetical protein
MIWKKKGKKKKIQIEWRQKKKKEKKKNLIWIRQYGAWTSWMPYCRSVQTYQNTQTHTKHTSEQTKSEKKKKKKKSENITRHNFWKKKKINLIFCRIDHNGMRFCILIDFLTTYFIWMRRSIIKTKVLQSQR